MLRYFFENLGYLKKSCELFPNPLSFLDILNNHP